MKSIRVNFKNKSDFSLAGILDLPASPNSFAVYAHCFTCSKDLPAAFHICKSLARDRIATLRFDFTGLGDSEGNFSDTTFSTNIDDIVSASDFLQSNYQPPRLLVGHSLGGTAAIGAAGKLDNISAVTTIASPHKPSHVLTHFEQVKKILEQQEQTSIDVSGREFVIKKRMLNDIESYDQIELVEKLGKPILIMHSPTDKTVTIQEASNLFMAAAHPKSFVSLNTIDHLVSEKSDAQYIGKIIASWAQRYID